MAPKAKSTALADINNGMPEKFFPQDLENPLAHPHPVTRTANYKLNILPPKPLHYAVTGVTMSHCHSNHYVM